MRRRLIAAGLAVAALAMLAVLVLDSQPLPAEAHLAHQAALEELDRSTEEFASLVASIESARAESQALGESAHALLERFEQSPDRLASRLLASAGRSDRAGRVGARFDAYSGTVADAASLTHAVFGEQSALVENLTVVRRAGPDLVERLRDIRLDAAARTTFALVAGALNYAAPGNDVDVAELRSLASELRGDRGVGANEPGRARALLEAADAVLAGTARVDGLTAQLGAIPVVSSATNLRSAAVERYGAALGAIAQARALLAIYATLLLGAATFTAYRLSQSYKLINRANAELETLNGSLERRVAQRTAELEHALAELQEKQVQLVQAEKMSSLGQLVAGISHEINTPLLYLANNAELIRERLDVLSDFTRNSAAAYALRPDAFADRKRYQLALADALRQLQAEIAEDDLLASIEEAKDLLDDSSAGLDDLTELAQGLKDFSRMDRAPVERFDINAGVERSLLIARSALKHKANVCKFLGELPGVQCAPSQLNQVFLNLLTNAAQAIEGHGEIVVKTALHDDAHVAVTISDTGCGIAPDNLERIRDPFFTTKGSGTGLGLAIVDQIVAAHDGELRIESELGKGSAFTLVLPIAATSHTRREGHEGLNGVEPGREHEPVARIAAAG